MRLVTRAQVVLACLLMVPAGAYAQSTIAGAVNDNTGGVLPGVTVEASSPVLIEGVRTAVTDGSGRYTIIDLRPGTYTVTFSLPGFSTQVREDVLLPADFTLALDVLLAVGGIAETVTVSGESPVVDIQRVQRTQTLTREVTEAIPTNNSLWGFAALVPGVKILTPDVGGTTAMQQNLMFGRGASSRQTTVEVDGLMANSFLDDGRFKQYMNPQMTAETSFTTSGMNAETGHGGLRINIIPREGGNVFSGSFFAGGTPRAWQNDNWNERLGSLGVRGPEDLAPLFNAVAGQPSGVPRVAKIYDVNGAFGGPIFQDRLWFFASYRDWGTDNVELNAIDREGEPAIDDNRINSGLLRLTYQANTSNKFAAYLDRISKRRFHQFGANEDRLTASATTQPNINYYTAHAKWTSSLSSRMLLEVGWSAVGEALRSNNQEGITVPQPAGRAQCLSTPCAPGSGADLQGFMGATADPWYTNLRRDDRRLGRYFYGSNGLETSSYPYNQSFLAAVSYVTGSHNIKVGVVNNWGKYIITQGGNGDINEVNYLSGDNPFGFTVPWIGPTHNNANCDAAGANCNLLGLPDSVSVRNSPNANRRDVVYDVGAYVQDSWTLDRLTINAGLRVDLAKPRNPEAIKGAGRFSAGSVFPALDGTGTWFSGKPNNLPTFGPDLAPRFSLVYDVFGNARTAAKFGWNRYYHAYGISSVIPLSSYAGAAGRSDTRDWFDVTLQAGTDTPLGPADCELVAVGAPGSCTNPWGTDGDNIVQDWEIGLPGAGFVATQASIEPDADMQRKFDDVLTVGVQQEVARGVSVTLEFRRRWTKDDRFRSYTARRFDVDANGNFVDNLIWVEEDRFLAPAPYTAIVPIYSIFKSAEAIAGQVDVTIPDNIDATDRFTGFEVSFNARMPGGGVLFGGWNTETPGQGESAGVRNNCGREIAEGDDPNDLRFCNEFSFPRNWRNEFKLSGVQPLPWDLQLAGSFQLYPGLGTTEFFRVDRRGSTLNHRNYRAPWYTPANCVDPCDPAQVVAGTQRIVTTGPTKQLCTSSTGCTMEMLPSDSVKFKPDWSQLDLSIAKIFNLFGWRIDARLEGFNILNNGIELSNFTFGSRGTHFGGQNTQFEDASGVLFGRVTRISVTARF